MRFTLPPARFLFLLLLVISRVSYAPVFGSKETFDGALDEWSLELQKSYLDPERPGERPQYFSSFERLKNEAFVGYLYGRRSWDKWRNPNADPFATMQAAQNGFLGRIFRGPMQRYVTQMTGGEPGADNLPVRMARYENEFMDSVKGYATTYGAKYFPEDAIVRAASTVSGMRYLAEMRGTPPKSMEALNAIALLHPVTDDLMDRGQFPKESLKKLNLLLEGVPQTANTPEEKVIFDFVNKIFSAFPEAENPELHWSIRALQREQIRSGQQKQRGDSLAQADLLDISFKKGGLSMLVAANIAFGKMSAQEHEYYFKQVGIFQLMDDFSDLYQDKKDNIETVWTRSLRRDGNLHEPMERFLMLQDRFHTWTQTKLPKTVEFKQAPTFMTVGIYATMMEAIARYPERNDKQIAALFASRLPVRFSTMMSLVDRIDRRVDKMALTPEGTCARTLKAMRPTGLTSDPPFPR